MIQARTGIFKRALSVEKSREHASKKSLAIKRVA